MKRTSLGKNAILNVTKTVLTLVFPLITFPYATRTLRVEDIGRFNFATSILSYFLLLAGLGISTYAIREGVRYRNDRAKLSQFASEIFSINLYSTLASYGLLFLTLLFVRKMDAYRGLILILSLEIILTTISMNWLFSIVEDFTFSALITCVVEAVSIILLFALVRDQGDLYPYTLINVFSATGFGLFMFFYAGKYVKLHLVRRPPLRHMRPILTVFSTMIATTIYINSDTTILGWLAGDYSVAQYGTAAKIYLIVKQLLNAVITVTIPRMAYHIGRGERRELVQLGQKLMDNMIAICMPAMVGLYCMSGPIVEIFAGKEYAPAYRSLQLLSIALIFAVFANVFVNGILIPFGQEKRAMQATILSAAINIILNFILIPYYKETAAAVTTIIAEAAICLVSCVMSRRYIKIPLDKKNLMVTAFGCGLIILSCRGLSRMIEHQVIYLAVGVAVSVAEYLAVQGGYRCLRKNINCN